MPIAAAAVVDGLERLRRGRTTLMIAHRLATLRHVDMRLRIEGGHVFVEQSASAARRALLRSA